MLNIIIKEVPIDEELKTRIKFMCDFFNIKPTIINGSVCRIEKANISTKNMISDGFKIRLLKDMFSSSNDDYVDLTKKVATLKDRYDKNMIDVVTIISIFVAVVIGMVSGISFSLEAFKSITNNNIYEVSLVTLVVGFCLFNLFYSLIKFVGKISGKDLDKKGYLLFVEVVLWNGSVILYQLLLLLHPI